MRQKVRNIVLLLALAPFLNGYRPGIEMASIPGHATHTSLPAPEKDKIQWLTLDEAQAKQAKVGKPILIDLYTDWCGWCKVMDKKTYARPEVAKYIMDNFYPVKLNAEGKEALNWQGKQYTYNSGSRIHNLAVFLTRGQLSFPQTIFVMPGDRQPQAIPGYLEVKDMELLLTYFGEGHYGKTAFPDYQKKFSPSWK